MKFVSLSGQIAFEVPRPELTFAVAQPDPGETAIVTGSNAAVGLVIPGHRGGWRVVMTRPGADGAHLISRYSERLAHEVAALIAAEFPNDLASLEWHVTAPGRAIQRVEPTATTQK